MISIGMEFPKGVHYDPNFKDRVEKNQIIYMVNSSQLTYKIDAESLCYATVRKEACGWVTSVKKILLHPQKYQPVVVHANDIPGYFDRVAVTDIDGTVYFPVRDVLEREVARVIPKNKDWGMYIPHPNQPDIDRGKILIMCGDVIAGTLDFIVPENEWCTTLGGGINANYIVNNKLNVMIQKSTILQPENANLYPNKSIDVIQIKELGDYQKTDEQISLEEIFQRYSLELPKDSYDESTTWYEYTNPSLSNGSHAIDGCCLLL